MSHPSPSTGPISGAAKGIFFAHVGAAQPTDSQGKGWTSARRHRARLHHKHPDTRCDTNQAAPLRSLTNQNPPFCRVQNTFIGFQGSGSFRLCWVLGNLRLLDLNRCSLLWASITVHGSGLVCRVDRVLDGFEGSKAHTNSRGTAAVAFWP